MNALKTISLLTLLALLANCSCSKNSTEPPEPPGGPDTTSHNFTWETREFPSPFGSGVWRDISVINENDIWAVGELYSDSIQPGLSYNAAHWDGQKWALRKITYNNSPWTINTVFAFTTNDVWYSAFVRWNGVDFFELPIPDILIGHGINKIWGVSSNDLYVVGTEGLTVHYNGLRWQGLDSGTNVNLLDIWGSPDGSVVWACGWQDFLGTVLLKIQETRVEKVYEDNDHWFETRLDSFSGKLTSIWTDNPDSLYVMTSKGMYIASSSTHGEAKYAWWNQGATNGFPFRIRGQAHNNIITVGSFNMITHYNGNSWKYFSDLYASDISLQSLAFRNRLFVGVGLKETGITSNAYIIMGTQQ